MGKNNVTERLSRLGFPLLAAAEEVDVDVTVADLVKSEDLRLWELFPAVLAYSMDAGMFSYDKARAFLARASERVYFDLLSAMSLALYEVLHLKFPWMEKVYQTLNKPGKEHVALYRKALKDGHDLKLGKYRLSGQRVKTAFENYFKQEGKRLKDLLSLKEEYGVEFALSEVFSPKQKELFLKKLRNERLTKTEKEYFSRVVKKKVSALANPQLHRLSQELLK